jgi:hypothetical protein
MFRRATGGTVHVMETSCTDPTGARASAASLWDWLAPIADRNGVLLDRYIDLLLGERYGRGPEGWR